MRHSCYSTWKLISFRIVKQQYHPYCFSDEDLNYTFGILLTCYLLFNWRLTWNYVNSPFNHWNYFLAVFSSNNNIFSLFRVFFPFSVFIPSFPPQVFCYCFLYFKQKPTTVDLIAKLKLFFKLSKNCQRQLWIFDIHIFIDKN